MAVSDDVLVAMTNEARKAEARVKISQLRGKINAMTSLMQSINGLSTDAQRSLVSAIDELNALEAGSGQGITADFGPFSTTDQALRVERFAGKAALVDFVQTHPSCSEEQAVEAYTTAALAVRPADRQWLLQETDSLRLEYTANLLDLNLITDDSWVSLAAWIVATPREGILGL